MANAKDSGFLLRKIPYSESSWILKAFTREHGLMSFMAKGARRQNSRLHGLMEPVLHLQFLFPAHARGEMRILSDVALLRDFPAARETLAKHALAQVCGEVMLKYLPDQAVAPQFHDLLLEAHVRLEASDPGHDALQATLAGFLLDYCALSGHQPQFRTCTACGGGLSGATVAFHVDQGCPACSRCHREEPGALQLREGTLRWLDAVQHGVSGPELGRIDAGRALEFLLLYLGRHSGGQKPLKSFSVWQSLAGGNG
jgi:DNA repair protein RecO